MFCTFNETLLFLKIAFIFRSLSTPWLTFIWTCSHVQILGMVSLFKCSHHSYFCVILRLYLLKTWSSSLYFEPNTRKLLTFDWTAFPAEVQKRSPSKMNTNLSTFQGWGLHVLEVKCFVLRRRETNYQRFRLFPKNVEKMSQVLPVSPLIHLLSDVSYFILAAPFIVYERLPPKLDSTDVALLRTLAWCFFFLFFSINFFLHQGETTRLFFYPTSTSLLYFSSPYIFRQIIPTKMGPAAIFYPISINDQTFPACRP